MTNKLLLTSLLLLGVLAGCGRSEQKPQEQVRAALDRGDLAEAERLASQISEGDPAWAEARMVLAAVAVQRGDPQAALEYYESIARDGSPLSVTAAMEAAQLQQISGHLSQAIDFYAYVLQHQPDHLPAHGKIADLYAATDQRWLADRHLTVLAKANQLNFKQLVLLTDFERRHPNEVQFLRECEKGAPQDPAVNLGLAAEAVAKLEVVEARRRLEAAIAADPQLGAAQALLGALLIDVGDAEFRSWYDRLPEIVHEHPGIWFVRGLWAARRQREDIAARCFWQAVRQMPTSHRAMYQLGLMMSKLDPDVGRAFSRRAEELFDLREHLSLALNSRGRNEAAMRHVIDLLVASGRDWEAWLWASTSQSMYENSSWPTEVVQQLGGAPDPTTPRIRTESNLAIVHDLSGYPTFDAELMRPSSPSEGNPKQLPGAGIQFVDQASPLGIRFTYHQGRIPGTTGVRMLESTGGGIGVLDFDRDGWPDLFFTQGEDWEHGSDVPAPSERYRDRLYRSLGTAFGDVTLEAQLPEEGGFGQGCSAGDFNNDGFTDVYIANIGVNQFLLNNGDGTFTDTTEDLGLKADAWTTSCLIADLNADGDPDLFDVNYLQGEKLHRMICEEHHCSPEAYVEAPDHLHISQGDGTVRFIPRGETEPFGAGLAVVAFRSGAGPENSGSRESRVQSPEQRSADHAHAGASLSPLSAQDTGLSTLDSRLSVFIANDHEPNFFLKSRPADNPENLELTDLGYLSGLAVNQDGWQTACMGVASGDLDGDGLVDLFVTNYKDEANNLYLQKPGGLFADEIGRTGVMAAGIPYVGWGTQFLDADNDGRLDLVVANGHVADFHEAGVQYHMPTQFFQNVGGGRFQQLPPDRVGPFFGEKLLGRSLATLDWNRDGLTDFALTTIASPVALLTNQTVDAGNFFAIRLHAVSSARDAIGAVVTITTGSETARQQRTAGDGYQVSNERVLRFGLGEHDSIDRVDIEWPSGAAQSIQHIPANTTLDVVEGRQQMTLWKGTAPLPFRSGTSAVQDTE